MSPHRSIAAILVLLTTFCLAARYRSAEPAYELALRENDRPGRFLFYAYPLADGRHGYPPAWFTCPFLARIRARAACSLPPNGSSCATFGGCQNYLTAISLAGWLRQ